MAETIVQKSYTRSVTFVKRNPLFGFLIAIGILLLLLTISKLMQPAVQESANVQTTKNVTIYSIGEGPKATYGARIEKEGVITIVAQSAGIVQNISLNEGDKVNQGQQIISLAANYQGSNPSSVQTQIAQTQYQNALDTFDNQNQLLQRQRDVATASAENAQQTRDISRQSIGETNDLINANQSQLDSMRDMLDDLNANNSGGSSAQQIRELEGTIGQLQGSVNQLRSAQRTTEYQAANDKPPATLTNLEKEIALKQLDVQQKTLELNKEISRLQVTLAYVNEATMYPASPFTGVIENIAVRRGQTVNPGTELATIAANEIETTAVLQVQKGIASALAQGEPSEAIIKNKTVTLTPYYVSGQATSGQLYTIKYTIPDEYQKDLTDGEYLKINLPLSRANTTSTTPLIPIDAVYQTQDKAYVLVASNNKAKNKDVVLGEVFGNFVEVQKGLGSGDQIILNRNVIAEDTIKINK